MCFAAAAPDMGIAPGGRMQQEIYEDPYDMQDWQTDASSRCFVHLCNSMVWQSIAGSTPPHRTPPADRVIRFGLSNLSMFLQQRNRIGRLLSHGGYRRRTYLEGCCQRS